MSLSGAVFVNRKNRHDAVKALAIAGEDMKKKGVSFDVSLAYWQRTYK